MPKGIAKNGKRNDRRPNGNMNEIIIEVNGNDKTYEFSKLKIEEAIHKIKEEDEDLDLYRKLYITYPLGDKNGKKYGMTKIVKKMVEIQGCPSCCSSKFDYDAAKIRFKKLGIEVYNK